MLVSSLVKPHIELETISKYHHIDFLKKNSYGQTLLDTIFENNKDEMPIIINILLEQSKKYQDFEYDNIKKINKLKIENNLLIEKNTNFIAKIEILENRIENITLWNTRFIFLFFVLFFVFFFADVIVDAGVFKKSFIKFKNFTNYVDHFKALDYDFNDF